MDENIELPAIKDSELRSVLDEFALSEKVDNCEIFCKSCNKIITWENIGALQVKKSTLLIYCNSPECIEIVSTEQK